ncbi:RNA polymerase sigma factor RpoE [soil metagenome]
MLVERSQSGDLAAFDALVTRYRGKVYAMIVNMVRNDADAWDLAQDVFLKAWKALPKFEARSSFFTWIYRITYNVTCDFVRRRKVTGSTEFDDTIRLDSVESGAPTAPRRVDTPSERMAGSELGSAIAAALDQLSDDHRAAIIMREIDGMKYEEIAEAMGCSTGTVMSRLFYARKRLQDLLADVRGEMS